MIFVEYDAGFLENCECNLAVVKTLRNFKHETSGLRILGSCLFGILFAQPERESNNVLDSN